MGALGGDAGVQAFYERYPYPAAAHDLGAYRARWSDPQRKRADFHLFWPEKPYREDFSILVAGCGTSQAARHAIRWPRAQVVGIDVSAESLRHSEALKRRHKLDNLQLRRLSLEQVADLGLTFDQIVCTGVLHHLADPLAGLSALRGALKAGGVMHLMLYAPYGRCGIYMMQEFFRRAGFNARDGDVGSALAVLEALPRHHPLARLLREAPDFSTEAALADALLHPQDRAFSVPQLFVLLRAGRMSFGRWLRQAPYSICVGSLARIAHAARLGDMPRSEQYAAAELFRGTMLHHSFVACRDDRPGHWDIDVFGDGWLGYVPIRAVDTLCVEERLPPGSAAVLINRTHTDTDIILPLDANELALFRTIDGARTIDEILVLSAYPRDAARALFERLWWHDQIVFDASRSGT